MQNAYSVRKKDFNYLNFTWRTRTKEQMKPKVAKKEITEINKRKKWLSKLTNLVLSKH